MKLDFLLFVIASILTGIGIEKNINIIALMGAVMLILVVTHEILASAGIKED